MRTIYRYENTIYQCVVSGELKIDKLGRIWRLKKRGWDRWQKRSVLRPCKRVRAEHDSGAYLTIRAMIGGKRIHTQAARLVYRHFKGKLETGVTINHENGKKKDNRPKNLEPATYVRQAQHAIKFLKRHKTLRQNGENNSQAKLRVDQAVKIKQLRAIGLSLKEIGKMFGVAFQTVSKIARGERWVKATSL